MLIAIIVVVTMGVIVACVSCVVQRRRSAWRNAAGQELALLADARALEYRSRTLLAGCGEDFALYDALVPPSMKQLGYRKGLLTARIAVAQARGAQFAMEYGEDADVANHRLRLAKDAFVRAEEIAERAWVMVAAQERTRRPDLREVPDAE